MAEQSTDLSSTKMQVVLKQDVSKLGKKGELVNVLNGFYRNHLLPKGMAEIASERYVS